MAEGGDVEQAELISAGVIVTGSEGVPRLRIAPAVVAWTVVVANGREEAGAFSRTSYWSPLVTTKSPSSFARTSMHAIMRFVNPSRGLGGRGMRGVGCAEVSWASDCIRSKTRITERVLSTTSLPGRTFDENRQ